jgi:hypothetical protein
MYLFCNLIINHLIGRRTFVLGFAAEIKPVIRVSSYISGSFSISTRFFEVFFRHYPSTSGWIYQPHSFTIEYMRYEGFYGTQPTSR